MFGLGNLGWTEILVISFLLLLLFGAKRLPEIGQSLGKGIREFKKSITASDDEPKADSGERPMAEIESPPKREEAH